MVAQRSRLLRDIFTILECRQALGTLPFGQSMVAPVIMAFGTDEQKKVLPDIPLVVWLPGYSSLVQDLILHPSTKAVRDGIITLLTELDLEHTWPAC